MYRLIFILRWIDIDIFAIPQGYHEYVYSQAIFDRCAELNGTVSRPTCKNMDDKGDWIKDVYEGSLILPECKYLKKKTTNNKH